MSQDTQNTIHGETTRPSIRATVVAYLRSFNLFPSFPLSTDQYDIQHQLVSTRVFLLLLCLCIVVLVIFTSQESINQTITVVQPEFEHFRVLVRKYPKTLNCPCESIAIKHNTFISLYPDFHQVCSSDFVSSNWSAHINAAADNYISTDFSYTGGPLFQALATFCNAAKVNLNISLITFNSNRFISAVMLAEDLFLQRAQSAINAFQTMVVEKFIQSFNVIRETTHYNSLMSGLLTNAAVDVDSFFLAGIHFESYNGVKCDFYVTSSCLTPVNVTRQQVNGSVFNFTIPDLYIGCYLVDAMRSSSLTCLYNQSCLVHLESILHSPVPFHATALDPSLSKLPVNSTIDTLLSQAMIERWNQSVSWSNYYEQCKPESCTYSIVTKHNVWYIITTIIGLIGGLVKILRLLIPRAVQFIGRKSNRLKQ